MWYIYDENTSQVVSKSDYEVSGVPCAYMDEDIDLTIYTVTVGNVQEVNGINTITFVTKKLKSNFELTEQIKVQNSLLVSQQEQLASIQEAIDFILMA
ncbi:MAG TPA: hypothetical protein DCE48_01355 [Lachnospiraceae bacterium]|uniref:hypothetical protein n=1 Tax=Anaerosporobacter sp. TaxID=1872529 RepID=UPI000EE6C352|nr:hypothetical protein [Anaerosporobacter sp.]HAB59358.1 hypothetical protein [Lachnospiraceae bacterium]